MKQHPNTVNQPRLAWTFIFFSTALISLGQHLTTGVFTTTLDIGQPKTSGNTLYNSKSQTYTLQGSGKNMWDSRDEFHYAFKKLSGDFILRARVQFIGEGVDPHRKIGWSVRPTLNGNDRHVSAEVHGDGLTSLQFRKTIDGITEQLVSTDSFPDIVQLERKGNQFIMSTAQFGDEFTSVILDELELPETLFVGLFICSHNESVVEKAQFTNVRIIRPAPETLVQYRDYLGSNLEVMDIQTGLRTILMQDQGSIQAPNWTVDGQTLIYNKEGLLYNFDLTAQQSSILPTDFANRNNNDHVLTFDGQTLGISHHSSDDDGVSIVYYLPVKGGIPVRVTPEGPSYFHGWSPDGNTLIYTGGRNNIYNIYSIAKSGGKETRLTNENTLDDGPEYHPSGKHIYFNSNRTGTMQLWRMDANGKNQTQLTFDKLNDWFPHISPDGKSIVFISFPADIPSGEHPFYKHVYIRQMPIEGGPIKIVAYVYGGQGTMNVPSWSPDGSKISFISNSIIE
ncbi:MAG: biopolymer transporter TolR [Flammeovirgaceae bacterium]|nr:biopolymer transporter TolR [Flammeovirgaceae bacterium]MBE63339.1 biopolymer transporter TolR [Flammeovirgaceae bacterium]